MMFDDDTCLHCQSTFSSNHCLLPIAINDDSINYLNFKEGLKKIRTIHEAYGNEHLLRNLVFQQWYNNDCKGDFSFTYSTQSAIENDFTASTQCVKLEMFSPKYDNTDDGLTRLKLSEKSDDELRSSHFEVKRQSSSESITDDSVSISYATDITAENEFINTDEDKDTWPATTTKSHSSQITTDKFKDSNCDHEPRGMLTKHQTNHIAMDFTLAAITAKRLSESNDQHFRTHDLTNSLAIDRGHIQMRPPTFRSSLSTKLNQPGALSKEITTTHSSFYQSFTQPETGSIEELLCLPYFLHKYYNDPRFIQHNLIKILKSYCKMITHTVLLDAHDHQMIRKISLQIMINKREPSAYTWFLQLIRSNQLIELPPSVKVHESTFKSRMTNLEFLDNVLDVIMNVLPNHNGRLLTTKFDFNIDEILESTLLHILNFNPQWIKTQIQLTSDMLPGLERQLNFHLNDENTIMFRDLLNDSIIQLSQSNKISNLLNQKG